MAILTYPMTYYNALHIFKRKSETIIQINRDREQPPAQLNAEKVSTELLPSISASLSFLQS